MIVTHKKHISELTNGGDYCFDSDGRVIMACPACAIRFLCPHQVVKRDPLTLAPSVICPRAGSVGEKIQPPCLHHFWVIDGKVEGLSL